MNLPRLPRQLARPSAQLDKQLWQPQWNCFCCSDTGMVRLNLVQMIIPDYCAREDLRVACQNPGCEASLEFKGDANFDQRFTAAICIQLDKLNRQDWKQTVEDRFELIRERMKSAAVGMSLRKCDRTSQEEELAQRQHQEILSR